MKFKVGDTVEIVESRIATGPCTVTEIKGSILLVEDSTGRIHELFPNQIRKQMLFG